MSAPPAEPGVLDATRRTRLANERTYLAWWRSALTAFAVALGAGKVIPELSAEKTTWPFVVLGALFAMLGAAYALYGLRRYRAVEEGLRRGDYAAPDTRLITTVSLVTVLLGLLTALAIAVGL